MSDLLYGLLLSAATLALNEAGCTEVAALLGG